jgi:ComF family protein
MNLLDFIFPKRCVGCGKIGKYFCAVCRAGIRPILSNEQICPMCGRLAFEGVTHPYCRTRYCLDGLTSFFHYDGTARKAIKSIKYRFVFDLTAEFISLLPESSLPKPSLVIPIPLHPARYRTRGFNQAEKLGQMLACRLNVAMKTDILRRITETPPQVEMKHKKKRLENMKNVFSVHNSSFTIPNSRVLLFDDVFTTGATMRSAASALKHVGTKCVWAVSMAR